MTATRGLPELAELHCRLFVHWLDGVGGEALWERPGGRGNPLGFLALHVGQMAMLRRQLGLPAMVYGESGGG